MDSPAAIRPRVRWPELDLHERRIVCLIGAAGFFNQYDLGLVSLFLRHIQADLAISEASVGWMGSAIRMGALPAFGFMLLADRLGRRRLLLWTIAGYTLCTVATAFAPSAAAFTAAQLVGRMFMEAEVTLGIVVVVEELRPGNRAWGVGVISLLAFLGRALGMALFAFVDDLPFGWRFAYLVGLFPLGLLVYLRRALPETRRFERAAQGTRTSVASLVRPALALLRAYPGRFAAVGCVGFFWGFSNVVVDFFMPKFVQEAHGWTPAEFVTVSVVGGALGFWGILLAGWLSDRYGRRRSFITFMFLEPIVAVAFFTAAPEWLLPIFAGWVFVGASNSVIGRTYASELFPTSHRSTASGAASVLLAIGMVAGLAIEGTLYPWFSSHWEPVRLIAATGLIAPLVIYLFYEETSGRTLEEIAPERGLRSHADLSTGDARIPIYGR